jgi:hypothetical protein
MKTEKEYLLNEVEEVGSQPNKKRGALTALPFPYVTSTADIELVVVQSMFSRTENLGPRSAR